MLISVGAQRSPSWQLKLPHNLSSSPILGGLLDGPRRSCQFLLDLMVHIMYVRELSPLAFEKGIKSDLDLQKWKVQIFLGENIVHFIWRGFEISCLIAYFSSLFIFRYICPKFNLSVQRLVRSLPKIQILLSKEPETKKVKKKTLRSKTLLSSLSKFRFFLPI